MRTNSSLLIKLIGIGVLFIAVPARADFEQWQYWAGWDTATKFSNEDDAADHMRAGPNSKDQYLDVRGPIIQTTRDDSKRKWTVQPRDPNVGAWAYYSCGAGTNRYSTPEEAKNVCLNFVQSGSSPCAPLAELDGEAGAWVESSGFFANGGCLDTAKRLTTYTRRITSLCRRLTASTRSTAATNCMATAPSPVLRLLPQTPAFKNVA